MISTLSQDLYFSDLQIFLMVSPVLAYGSGISVDIIQ